MPSNTSLRGDSLLQISESQVEASNSHDVARTSQSKPNGHPGVGVSALSSTNTALRVRRLQPQARVPAVAHAGEDLGYDVFALEAVLLAPHRTAKVRTGIAVEARHPETGAPLGLLVRDRSSMAARGVATTGGVIDGGYRGEILIVMTNLGEEPVELKAGEKIAQMVPVPVLTGQVEEVEELEASAREAKGFGSSGQ